MSVLLGGAQMNKEIQQEWMEFDTDGLDYFGGRQEGK